MKARQRSRLARFLGSTLVTVQLLHGASVARASVVVPLSLAEMTEAAAVIVDGSVVDVRTVQGQEGVERMVLLRVEGTWKGDADGSVYVRLAGGRLGRLETRVVGVPSVEPGDRLVWFLTPHPHGGYSVVGLHQGALRTLMATDGEPRVLAPSKVAARGDVRRAPRRLADLAADVRALVAAGGAR